MSWKQIKVQFGCMTFKVLDNRKKESHLGNNLQSTLIVKESCSYEN